TGDGTSLSCDTPAGGGGGWTAVDATDSVKGIVSLPAAGGLVATSGALSLATQGGVTPGSYAKVTINSHGIVTGHGTLAESDLPTIDDAGKVSGSAITSGEISGTTSWDGSG